MPHDLGHLKRERGRVDDAEPDRPTKRLAVAGCPTPLSSLEISTSQVMTVVPEANWQMQPCQPPRRQAIGLTRKEVRFCQLGALRQGRARVGGIQSMPDAASIWAVHGRPTKIRSQPRMRDKKKKKKKETYFWKSLQRRKMRDMTSWVTGMNWPAVGRVPGLSQLISNPI